MRKLRPVTPQDEPEAPGVRCRRRVRRVRVNEGSARPAFIFVFIRWSFIFLASFTAIAGTLYYVDIRMIRAAEADDIPFDSAAWKAIRQEGSYRSKTPDDTRLKMHRDLLDRELLFGKTRKEVTELLGPPDSALVLSRIWRDSAYWVGPRRGLFPYGSTWLGLYYDKLDRVSETRIIIK